MRLRRGKWGLAPSLSRGRSLGPVPPLALFPEFPPLDARKLEKLEDALKRRIPDLMRTPDYASDAVTHRTEEEGGYQRWW